MIPKYITDWENDLKYYDTENLEVNTLLKSVNFEGKKVIDVGCGISRLALPISKVAKMVVAVDVNKDVINYCEQYKKKTNIQYVHTDVREVKNGDFDIAIFGQPDYADFKEKIKTIHRILNKDGELVILKWMNRGNDYNSILSPFWDCEDELMERYESFSRNYYRILKGFFNKEQIYNIKPYYTYPSKETLIKSITNDIPRKLSEKDEILLRKIAEGYNHKKIYLSINIETYRRA